MNPRKQKDEKKNEKKLFFFYLKKKEKERLFVVVRELLLVLNVHDGFQIISKIYIANHEIIEYIHNQFL